MAAVQLDLADADAGAAAIERLAAALGPPAVLVANAAVNTRGTILEQALDDWRTTLEVNLIGPFACAQAAARLMAAHGGGAIVHVSSVVGHVPLPEASACCAAKAGLEMLTRVMAFELAPHGIRVNAVAPGHTATPMNYGDQSVDAFAISWPQIPLARSADPAEIARAVAFLASPDASYATGATLLVDGGLALVSGPGVLQQATGLPPAGRAGDLIRRFLRRTTTEDTTVELQTAPAPRTHAARRARARIAILGLGRMGAIHLEQRAAGAEIELVAVADGDGERAAAVAARAGVPAVAGLAELLAHEPDGVVVATPSDHHAAAIEQSPPPPAYVFCEKPGAPRLDDAERAVAAAGGGRDRAAGRLPDALRPRSRGARGAAGRGRAGAAVPVPRPPARRRAAAGRLPSPAPAATSATARSTASTSPAGCWARWTRWPPSAPRSPSPLFEQVGDVDNAIVVLRFASGALGKTVEVSRVAGHGFDSAVEGARRARRGARLRSHRRQGRTLPRRPHGGCARAGLRGPLRDRLPTRAGGVRGGDRGAGGAFAGQRRGRSRRDAAGREPPRDVAAAARRCDSDGVAAQSPGSRSEPGDAAAPQRLDQLARS